MCDLGAVGRADAVTVDALARLQLTARRLGCRIDVINACPQLEDLLVLVGLRDVVPLSRELGLESGREPEHREERGGVEEERDPGDLSAGDL